MERRSGGPSDPYFSEAPFYDFGWDDLKDYRFYLPRIRRSDVVLDAMCGTGRLTTQLAAAARRVYGFDVSPAMLKIAGQRVARAPPQVRRRIALTRGDAVAVSRLGFPRRSFDVVILAANSLPLVRGRRKRLRVLQGFRRLLKPAGQLMMQLDNPAVSLESSRPPFVDRIRRIPREKLTYLRILAENRRGRVIHTRAFHVLANGRTGRISVAESASDSEIPSAPEIRRLLTDPGFDRIRFYGSFLGARWSPRSPVLMVSARSPAS